MIMLLNNILYLILLRIIPFIVRFVHLVDAIATYFGRRLFPISTDVILAGLPQENKAEAETFEVSGLFRMVCEDARASRDLTLRDRLFFYAHWRRILQDRVYIKKAAEQFPEVQQTRIDAPVFLIGLARSGTTLLQRLMACDDCFFSPMAFEVFHPYPSLKNGAFIETPGRHANWRNSQKFRSMDQFRGFMAGLGIADALTIHPIKTDLAEECFPLLERSMSCPGSTSPPDGRRWTQWFCSRPPGSLDDVYRFHKLQLQLIACNSLEGKTCLLKSPLHMVDVDALRSVYPDVRLVFSFRPLREAIPSHISLLWASKGRGSVPSPEYGPYMLQTLSQFANYFALAAERCDSTGENPIFLYTYRDFMQDPMGMLVKIYEHIGHVLSASTQQKMAEYLRLNPQHKEGVHRYSLEKFHLTEEMIRREYKPYIDYMQAKGYPMEDIV